MLIVHDLERRRCQTISIGSTSSESPTGTSSPRTRGMSEDVADWRSPANVTAGT